MFQKGLAKGDKTTHALLLKCVIIITSVVPQQLPMQMALAVNTALMALMKKGVFCTEPCVCFVAFFLVGRSEELV